MNSRFESPHAIDPEKDLSPEEQEKLEEFSEKVRAAFREKFGGREAVEANKGLKAFHEMIPHLIMRAREAANEEADSWRKFHVGCACLAFNNALEGIGRASHLVFTGSNSKPEEDGPKICAEQIAVGSATHHKRENQRSKILGLVVAGTPQEDSKSGFSSQTLHPCHNCRKLITKRLERNGDKPEEVALITIGLDDDNFEVMTWKEMLELHEGENRNE